MPKTKVGSGDGRLSLESRRSTIKPERCSEALTFNTALEGPLHSGGLAALATFVPKDADGPLVVLTP